MLMNKPLKKVYVVGPQLGYARSIHNKELVDDITKADIVVLTGGADISPSTYGKKKLPCTWDYIERDAFEINAYNKVRPDQLVVGVCRGAQLLCALNGGNLVQDADRHAMGSYHNMQGMPGTPYEGHNYAITSLHHQMMYPFDIPQENYTIVFRAYPNRSTYYVGDGINPDIIRQKGEPEIIIFHAPDKPVGLAIQGHPEMMEQTCDTVVMFNDMIDDLLINITKKQ